MRSSLWRRSRRATAGGPRRKKRAKKTSQATLFSRLVGLNCIPAIGLKILHWLDHDGTALIVPLVGSAVVALLALGT